MRAFSRLLLLSVCFALAGSPFTAVAAPIDSNAAAPENNVIPHHISNFVGDHCVACHEGDNAEAGLDLKSLNGQLDDAGVFQRWTRIFDRVHDGEMPPKESGHVSEKELKSFLHSAQSWLANHERLEWSKNGRVQGKRLTNLQLERTLHDLLGIDIPLASLMPEEQRTAGYTTVANGQPMSHFQLERHLNIVDTALDEAFRRAIEGDRNFKREFDAQGVARTNPDRRCREPEMIDGFAVTWSSRLIFYGRLPATTAREDGWYRFTIRAKALKSPEDYGVWCTVRSGRCVSSAPLLNWVGAFEATDAVQEWTFETWLPRGDMLEVRPGDDTLKMGRFEGGQVGVGEGGPQDLPGVAIESLTMEKIHYGAPDDQIAETLFGDLKIQPQGKNWRDAKLVSARPKQDVAKLMTRFADRAFRRPANPEDVQPYIQLVQDALADDQPLVAALRSGYRALLCSPRFLYFQEPPGELDSYAIASRLSYFLWNTMPDEELLSLARHDELRESQVIRQQVDRMLVDPRGDHFIKDFAAQWLDLSLIDFTTPDRRMFPEFDVIVQHSMVAETERYLQEMLDQDLGIERIIQSDSTWLNERLARFYEIDGVQGDELQKVSLSADDHRSGLLTHGSVLKITANGTNTSPVIRGVWISERLLGVDIPAPPAGVPAIEPDVRGATTIREMLEKHKSSPNCASCHVKIDPPGFALENFDPAGQWRSSYPQFEGRKRIKGIPVNAGFVLPSGETFEDLKEFQAIVAKKQQRLAENVAKQLMTYGTGSAMSFADRAAIAEIAANTENRNYGLRSLVQEVAASELFRTK